MSATGNFTKEELVEGIKNGSYQNGFVGIICPSCPFPKEEKLRTTANVDVDLWEWICPSCNFHILMDNIPKHPIFPSPTHGASGHAIIAAYEELGFYVKDYLNGELK